MDELYHHGVKGMQWGVWNEETRRRYQGYTRPDGYLKKGSQLLRVSIKPKNTFHKHNPLSGNMKYVSTNADDHYRWANEFVQRHSPNELANVAYSAKKDLKIASAKQAGETYSTMVKNNTKIAKEADELWGKPYLLLPKMELNLSEDESYINALKNADHDDITKTSIKEITASVALKDTDNTYYTSGKKLIKELSKLGYDAVEDALGWDTAVDPIIVFNPKKNLKVEYDEFDSNYRKR